MLWEIKIIFFPVENYRYSINEGDYWKSLELNTKSHTGLPPLPYIKWSRLIVIENKCKVF